MAVPLPPRRVVWVVDDSALDVERARRLLSEECDVEVFRDGSAALERLADSPAPDVMVLDWVMPGISGVDVCKFLRSAEGGHAQVGVLLLTTHRHTEQIVEGLSAGANDYLAKPYADAELVARVRALIRTRQLLERAEQAEALSFRLLQTAPDALIALDDALEIKFVNDSARAALQADHVVGRPLADVLPELAQRLRTPAAANGLGIDIAIGDRFFSATRRSLASSNTFSTIISLRDVTERRRLDTRRLDFYSIIAHDLRTPLHALNLRTKLMLQGRHGVLTDGMQADLLKMDANLQSLIEMINDFLELARLDNVSYELQTDEIDLGALVADTMETLRPQLEAQSLTWKRELDERTKVVGDPRRLQQVLTNLISNAVKFTGERGTITTRVARRDHDVEVSVTDTGRGIEPQSLPTLFERYTRARGTDKVQGTGLGLMIVREIVEAHGGKVGVESTVGVGSRFWFRMPMVAVSA
jgi:two-component system phosphate regulon sensor histidine kinase PhoR